MKRMLLMLGLLFYILMFGEDSLTMSVMAQGESTSLRGHVYGILTVSQEIMSELSEDQRHMKFGKEGIVDFKSGSREVRVGIKGVIISVGTKRVATDEDGEFYLSGLRPGKKYVILSFGKEKFLQQLVFLKEVEENYQDFFVVKKLDELEKSMGGAKAEKQGDFPCLKKNFLCFNPVGSDCYKSLMKGTNYCWRELLKLKGEKWCNGARNCSTFIGHKQEQHCDWTP